ncbi:(methyl)glyoxal oxidase [Ranunculus cassubicifolius]
MRKKLLLLCVFFCFFFLCANGRNVVRLRGQNKVLAEQDSWNDEEEEVLYETSYMGGWELVKANAGISAMHLVLFPNTTKAVMFDATNLGPSQLRLPKGVECRRYNNGTREDCWAHASEFDTETGEIRALKVETNTWCSSGGLNSEGVLVQSGGYSEGSRAVRYLWPCENCNWVEYPNALSGPRWYATQQILADGSFIVVGGRNMLNYEFIPSQGRRNPTNYYLQFLKETRDNIPGSENNLYPHVHLSTDGNVFILANCRAILLDPVHNTVVRQYPDLPDGARNYPASSSSAVLPIRLSNNTIHLEVLVCGGSSKWAFHAQEINKEYLPALQSCGRIRITDHNPNWEMEEMPSRRVMGDMLILPTGDLLLINGAKNGSAGWEHGENPNFNPVLYKPELNGTRFEELNPTTIPRMYHSTSAVLPDGKILVAGSSSHVRYEFHGVKYPTEVSVEKFSPPYLDPDLAAQRPIIATQNSSFVLRYGEVFHLEICLNHAIGRFKRFKVRMYSPPFTTHGYSMNQRMIVLAETSAWIQSNGNYWITLTAPPNGAVAPPGYYMLFVVYHGLPSKAIWVKLGS